MSEVTYISLQEQQAEARAKIAALRARQAEIRAEMRRQVTEAIKAKKVTPTAAENLVGRTFGTWKVLRYGCAGAATPVWLCRCAVKGCKFERGVNGAQLRHKPPRCEECVKGKRRVVAS